MAQNDINWGQQWYDQWEKGMTAWWDQVLDSPAFLETLGQNVSQQAQAHGAYAEAMDTQLSKMNLPTRSDLVRVARIATLLEEKVLAVEDTLLKLEDVLARLEKETITARVEAAEARLEVREQLAAMHERLEALDSGAKTTSSRSRKKTTGAKNA